MNKIDWVAIRDWGRKALIFTAPALIAFLTALQTGSTMKYAWGALYSAILSAFIGFLMKLNTGDFRK